MLVKTITYTDYYGQKQTRDFRFHLTDSELFELQYGTRGGFIAASQAMMDNHDESSIFRTFKDLILKSYGEISEDGQRFMKSPEISLAFSQTPAYDIIFQEIVSSKEKQDEFIMNVLPGDKEKLQHAITQAANEIEERTGIEMTSNAVD